MTKATSILEKNKISKILFLLSFIVFIQGSWASETPTNTVNTTDARARLDKGSIALAGEFLYHLVSTKPEENIVASGTSLLIPLAQLALWTKGLILEQLLNLLNLKSKEEIKAVFPELTKEFKNQSNVEFEVATKYYANIQYPLSQNFITDSKTYFDSEGENIDFRQNVDAAGTINDWVKNRTREKITELVDPSMFSEATRLVLVNAIYYLGNWTLQFNPNDTTIKDFYKSNGDTVPLEMMYQQNTFNYFENDVIQALEMLYKNPAFSFLVILPKNKSGLLDTVTQFRNGDELTNVINNLSPEKVQVHIPKFIIDTKIDIQKLLKEKYGAIFDPYNDGFEGVLEVEENLYVSDAVQKAHITVDELGTEAAAATAVTLTRMSVPLSPARIYIFDASHPFLFYIKYAEMLLFCGTLVK